MDAAQRISPFPGYVILEPYDINKNKKKSGYFMPKDDSENAPKIGKIVDIGEIPVEVTGKLGEWFKDKDLLNLASKTYAPFSIGMIVAYKKYDNVHPIKLGTKEYIAVGFESLLFELKEQT